MSGFPILDLVAGMIFIFFLLSIICSSGVEMVLTTSKIRAKILEEWLYNIFEKPITIKGKSVSLGQAIMDHCSVTVLSEEGKAPTYMDAKNFVSALLEKITYDDNNPKSVAKDIDDYIKAIEDSTILSTELQRVFLMYANEAKDTYIIVSVKTASEVQLFRHKIETWFDSSMERLGGDLKRRYSRPLTFVMAVLTAVLLNADSISIAKYLYSNPEARTKIATQAYAAAENDSIKSTVNQIYANLHDSATKKQDSATLQQITDSLTANVNSIKKSTAALNDMIPLGWNSHTFDDAFGKFDYWMIPQKMAGLLATILAIMMGAPFWFDILNKISNLRGSGSKPQTADTSK